MNEVRLKQIEKCIDSLISLRTAYIAIVVALITGMIGLFYNFKGLNVGLFITGLITFLYFSNSKNIKTNI